MRISTRMCEIMWGISNRIFLTVFKVEIQGMLRGNLLTQRWCGHIMEILVNWNLVEDVPNNG